MTADLVRRSPLGPDSVVAAADGVEIRERPFLAQLLLRMPPTAVAVQAVSSALGVEIPTTSNRLAVGSSGRMSIWLGPDEWLVVDEGDPGALESAVLAASASRGGTAVDVSAHRTLLDLVGPRVRDVLAAGSSVDFHDRAFPVGTAVQTPFARVDVIVGRTAPETWLVAVRASFARYLADWLRDAIDD